MLTLGEWASAVFSSPWTIQGWRPISVRIHPDVAAMNGNAIVAIAVRRNQRDFSSLRLRYSHAPTAATRNIATPRNAITRIAQ